MIVVVTFVINISIYSVVGLTKVHLLTILAINSIGTCLSAVTAGALIFIFQAIIINVASAAEEADAARLANDD